MSYPLLMEADQLEKLLGDEQLLIVDLTKATDFVSCHIPGARFIDYPRIVGINKPVMGLLPEQVVLEGTLRSIGLNNDMHVVAYDEEGGGKAGRLLWTLECFGHTNYSLLNGGIQAWISEGHAIESGPMFPCTPGNFSAQKVEAPIATREEILEQLDNYDTVLLDARSPEEYAGTKRYANRGGRIPGAINWDWVNLFDRDNHFRMHNLDELQETLNGMGITADKTVINYCHTHHRSSLTYILLKILGYPNIKGYPGSWSDWGNREDTPIET